MPRKDPQSNEQNQHTPVNSTEQDEKPATSSNVSHDPRKLVGEMVKSQQPQERSQPEKKQGDH